jgi:hypothetical protein
VEWQEQVINMKTTIIIYLLVGASLILHAQEHTNINTTLLPPTKEWNSLLLDSIDTNFSKRFKSDINMSPPVLNFSPVTLDNNKISPTDPFKEIKMSVHVPIHYSDYTYSNVYGYIRLNDKSWISTARTNDFYYSLGTVSMASGSYNYLLGDNMTLSVGSYLTKYNIHHNLYNGAGINSNFRVSLTEHVFINAFGQYSLTDKQQNGFNPYSTMYPATNFGGSIELKVTNKWGINAGMVREWVFDPWKGSGRWENRPFITPVFY